MSWPTSARVAGAATAAAALTGFLATTAPNPTRLIMAAFTAALFAVAASCACVAVAESNPKLALGIAIVAAGVVGAIVGVQVAHELSSAGDPSPSPVAAGRISVTPGPAWRNGVAQIPRLEVAPRDRISIVPTDSARVVLVAGIGRPGDGTLIPRGLRNRLATAPPEGRPLDLPGGLQAYFYPRLRLEGSAGKRLSVIVAPTFLSGGGVAAAACHGDATTGDARFEAAFAECEEVLYTLALTRGDGRPLGPDEDYADDLSRGLASAADMTRLHAELDSQVTSGDQVAKASALAEQLHTAAGSLATAGPSPSARWAHRRIVARLDGVGDAYARLEVALGDPRGDQGAVDRAVERIRERYAKLRYSVASLRQAGYVVH